MATILADAFFALRSFWPQLCVASGLTSSVHRWSTGNAVASNGWRGSFEVRKSPTGEWRFDEPIVYLHKREVTSCVLLSEKSNSVARCVLISPRPYIFPHVHISSFPHVLISPCLRVPILYPQMYPFFHVPISSCCNTSFQFSMSISLSWIFLSRFF